MTRLGTVTAAMLGALLGAVWGALASDGGTVGAVLLCAALGGGLWGAISYSWELR